MFRRPDGSITKQLHLKGRLFLRTWGWERVNGRGGGDLASSQRAHRHFVTYENSHFQL